MADLIAGPDFSLTPTEAFVLGGAFLIHDIGMGLAAYPNGLAQLRCEKTWPDSVASILRRRFDRAPTDVEIGNPPPDVEKEAIGETLRSLHAKHADRLALIEWIGSGGTKYHLIESPELRDLFGSTIGRVAYSHWWSVSRLRESFTAKLGAPTWCPRDWTVDPLKVACLLRVADASHIDSRRAPAYLRALRNPQGIASSHWAFQERIHQPSIASQRLVYTSGRPFSLEDAPAWWLCLETLQMIDRELRQTDALMADTHIPRFDARGVAGIDDPSRLVAFVPTEGWAPVDARVRVTDVPSLVQRLGGEQLYGKDSTVPLRELIQNASDAVRARRLLRDLATGWGDIIVRMGSDETGPWLEVEDNGVGMSSDVLTGPLLDFGSSYWNSWLMRQELTGLMAKGFNPTGRYGIGFFSVFMWGHHVRVTTRRFDDAERDTRVLEFSTGPSTRPILRRASESDCLHDGGTRVRVWLKMSPTEKNGLLWRNQDKPWTLKRLCAWLCPGLDVNLSVEEANGKRVRVVAARDWMTIDGKKLLERIAGPKNGKLKQWLKEDIERCAELLRPIYASSGEMIGRASLAPQRYMADLGVVVVGGLRAYSRDAWAGVLAGTSSVAARSSATPVVNPLELQRWATEQRQVVLEDSSADARTEDDECLIAESLYRCGANLRGISICRGGNGWKTIEDIEGWVDVPNKVFLVDDYSLSQIEFTGLDFVLNDDVLYVREGDSSFGCGVKGADDCWPEESSRTWADDRLLNWRWWSLESVVVAALARAWGVPIEAVLGDLALREDDERKNQVVGTVGGSPFSCSVFPVCNPKVR